MKLYGVFFEKEDMRVDLMTYESKELASPLNYHGLPMTTFAWVIVTFASRLLVRTRP